MHMDEFIDQLLRNERFLGINLPRMPKRYVLEEDGELDPYISKLDLDLGEESADKSKSAILKKYGSDSGSAESEEKSSYKRKRD